MTYVPPFAQMKGAVIAILIIIWMLLIIMNDTKVEVDPYWDRGLFIALILVVALEITPLIVKARSPKFVSNRHGDSISSNMPIMVIPAQDHYPELGIWPLGGVDALGVKTNVGSTAYAIFPTELAYKRGKNLECNAWLESYVDHAELPPHALDSLRRMTKYNPTLIVQFGVKPDLVNTMIEKDKDTFRRKIMDLGVSAEKFEEALGVLESYAVKVSPFRYEKNLTDIDKHNELRIKNLDKKVQDLYKEVTWWQGQSTRQKKILSPEPTMPEPSMFSKAFGDSRREDRPYPPEREQ